MRDPMLHAAAEALRNDPDHLRWMSYADDELHRLREELGLPTPAGYSQGRPNYPVLPGRTEKALRETISRAERAAEDAYTLAIAAGAPWLTTSRLGRAQTALIREVVRSHRRERRSSHRDEAPDA